MCGILGSVNFTLDNNVLDLLQHRGPDDAGIKEIKVNRNLVYFGHRRLSILDLSSAGHQPMSTNCGKYLIIFNGEVYNHMVLRRRLPEDIVFKGHSDTETILYYIREFGISGIKDFNGIFAFAFLDIVHQKLFLVRDPFGVKPLYYHVDEKARVIFSSEVRPINASLDDLKLNKDALASLLRLRFNASPDTLLQTKKILPGHYVEIDLKKEPLVLQSLSYTKGISTRTGSSTRSMIKIYGDKLEKAVKRQLLSDVEVGILLSGGIDSAVVAAMAKKHYEGKLKAFTIGFEGSFFEDEIKDAAETARILGLVHHYKKISFVDFLNVFEKCVQIVEEPLATTSIIPMYFLAELASKHVKVVLTGQGADEPLGGYTKYKLELIRDILPGFMRKKIPSLMQLFNTHNENLLRGANAITIGNEVERFLSVYEIFTRKEIFSLISWHDQGSHQKISYLNELLNSKIKRHSADKMMSIDARLNLADDLLNYTDKITMNFSLECRVPMLDLELVSFIESLPTNMKLNISQSKIIHKRFANEILPKSIINRKKKGFLSPTHNWFKSNVEIVKEILLSPGTDFSNLFNQKYVAEIINLHLFGYNKEKQIFLLLSIYYWLKLVNENHNVIH